MLAMVLAACLWLSPVPGAVVAGYDPGQGFAGHWGVDFGVEEGTDVAAPADGVVTFAGTVAGMRSVTILVGSDLRISVSYLSSIGVSSGDAVAAGQFVGRSGRAHGEERLHVSVRVGGRYVDPERYFLCNRDEPGTIRLLPDR